MRLPFHALALAAVASLTLALPHKVHASHAVKGNCQHVDSSMQICAPQGNDKSYLIEQGNRQVRLFIVDGEAVVLPEDGTTVRIASFPATAQMPGITATVYSDNAVEIDILRDAQQRLSWVVRPLIAPKLPHLQVMCTGAGCSGNQILLSIE